MNSHRYRIEYGPSAIADLDRLPPRERAQVLRNIERLQHGIRGSCKRLPRSQTLYRLLMGDYRVFFDVAANVLVIRRIGHRKDAYA